MRKALVLAFILILLFACSAVLAEELSFTYVPSSLSEGKNDHVTFNVPSNTVVSLYLTNEQGETKAVLRENLIVGAGSATLPLSLPTGSEALPEGGYLLLLVTADDAVSYPIMIGENYPSIISASTSSDVLEKGSAWVLDYTCSVAGTVTVDCTDAAGHSSTLAVLEAQQGGNTFVWDGTVNGSFVSSGLATITVTLASPEGRVSAPRQFRVMFLVPTPVPTATPAPIVRPSALETETIEGDFWSMEVGNYDWDTIWKVMPADMTVISGKDQRATYKLRATPDNSSDRSNIVGEVTFESQGVHVL